MTTEPFVIQQNISYHADFFVPEAAKKQLLICLHGYGQSKEIAMKFGQAATTEWSIAALQAPYPHFNRRNGKFDLGYSWVSDFNSAEAIRNHHQFIIQVIEEAYNKELVQEKKAVLFGFSQSVSLNYRFAAAYPNYCKGLIAVAGAAPTDWPEQTDKPKLSCPALHIAPTEDEAYPLARAHTFRDKLRQHCNDLSWHEESGGHRVPRASYKVMKAWLELHF